MDTVIKTPTPSTPDVPLGMGPTMVPPLSTSPDGFFIVGSDDRPMDNRIVALAIGIHADIKVGDREFSSSMSVHEALILRHYLDMMGGGCTMRFSGAWPPGLSRYRRLTQDNLKNEVARLSRMIVPRKDAPPLECMAMFFPGTLNERMVKMHKVMEEQYQAWEKLLEKAQARLMQDNVPGIAGLHPERVKSLAANYITEQEIEGIVKMADPAAGQLDAIELREIVYQKTTLAAPPTQEAAKNFDALIAEAGRLADAADPAGERVHAAFQRLKDAGFKDSEASDVAALLERADSADKVADEDIIRAAGGKAKLAAAKLALKGPRPQE